MRTYYWLLVFLGCLGVENGISQTELQLGFHYSMGRSYMQIDYGQATSENLEAKAGLVVPLGLELAWIVSPHLRVSSGFSITSYGIRVDHPENRWGFNPRDDLALFQIPLDISYYLFDQRSARKNIFILMGASYNLVDTYSGASGGSSRRFNAGVDEGTTYWMSYSVDTDVYFSLRFGFGQEVKLGKQDRWALHIFALYNLGLSDLWEGDFYYWDKSLPNDNVQWPATYPEVMPEATEKYNFISSRASYFTAGVKLLYSFKRRNAIK